MYLVLLRSIKHQSIDLKNKTALVLGGGGVVPSIISALEKLSIMKIFLMNRTFEKIKKLKENFPKIELLKWGEIVEFDIIINATSIGLKIDDKINLNLEIFQKRDKIFYDTIYNPPMTNFLKIGKQQGHMAINGKFMLVYQAQKSFKCWNNVTPKVNEKFFKTF